MPKKGLNYSLEMENVTKESTMQQQQLFLPGGQRGRPQQVPQGQQEQLVQAGRNRRDGAVGKYEKFGKATFSSHC